MQLVKQSTAPITVALSSRHKNQNENSRSLYTVDRVLRPAPNVGLPALDTALDSAAMTAYFQAYTVPGAHPGRPLLVVDHELLDYKPSQRGLIRYELATEAGRATTTVFGKLFADATQLARVDQVLHWLWDDVFASDPHCSTPQPLGVIPELTMLLYVPAEGQFLDEVLTGERALYAMDLTARWLSTLHRSTHRSSIRIAKKFDLANELMNLAAWAALVGQRYPDLAGLAQRALHYLQQHAPELTLATQTPIHKDFHYRHVLVERGVKVIDFDELRLGDPNFDLAHFCANLHLLAYRRHGTPQGLRSLEQRFLAAYARNRGWTQQTVDANRTNFLYFYVYTCLKLARQLSLGVGPSPVPTGEERREQVEMILGNCQWAIING